MVDWNRVVDWGFMMDWSRMVQNRCFVNDGCSMMHRNFMVYSRGHMVHGDLRVFLSRHRV